MQANDEILESTVKAVPSDGEAGRKSYQAPTFRVLSSSETRLGVRPGHHDSTSLS